MVIQLDDAKIKVKLDIGKLEADLDKADKERGKRKREKGRGRDKGGTTVIAVPGLGKAGSIVGIVALIEIAERYILPALMQALRDGDWLTKRIAAQMDKRIGQLNNILDESMEGWVMGLNELGVDKEFVRDAKDVIHQMRDAGLIGTAKSLMSLIGDMKSYVDHAALLGHLPGVERLRDIGLGTIQIRLAEEEMTKAMQQRESRRLTAQFMKWMQGR